MHQEPISAMLRATNTASHMLGSCQAPLKEQLSQLVLFLIHTSLNSSVFVRTRLNCQAFKAEGFQAAIGTLYTQVSSVYIHGSFY